MSFCEEGYQDLTDSQSDHPPEPLQRANKEPVDDPNISYCGFERLVHTPLLLQLHHHTTGSITPLQTSGGKIIMDSSHAPHRWWKKPLHHRQTQAHPRVTRHTVLHLVARYTANPSVIMDSSISTDVDVFTEQSLGWSGSEE